jgi:hypothetical protein
MKLLSVLCVNVVDVAEKIDSSEITIPAIKRGLDVIQ